MNKNAIDILKRKLTIGSIIFLSFFTSGKMTYDYFHSIIDIKVISHKESKVEFTKVISIGFVSDWVITNSIDD